MEDLTRQPRTNIDHEFTMTIEGFELQPTKPYRTSYMVSKGTATLSSDMSFRIIEVSAPCPPPQRDLLEAGAWDDFTLAITVGEWDVLRWPVASLLRRWRDDPRGPEFAVLADGAHGRFVDAERRVRAGDLDGIEPLLTAARAIAETDRSPGVRLSQGLLVPPRQNFHPRLLHSDAPQPGPLTIGFRGVFLQRKTC